MSNTLGRRCTINVVQMFVFTGMSVVFFYTLWNTTLWYILDPGISFTFNLIKYVSDFLSHFSASMAI